MTRRGYGLIILALGVVTFAIGLYGTFAPPVSVPTALVGAVAAFIGLMVLVYGSKDIPRSVPNPYVVTVLLVAGALHVYEQLPASSPSTFGYGWVLWALTPYIVCTAVSCFRPVRAPALFGAVVALGFDLVAHYDVFINPQGSTAALALVFIPLWNTIAFAPLAIFVAWLVTRHRAGREQHAP
jgi:hypothetical protein